MRRLFTVATVMCVLATTTGLAVASDAAAAGVTPPVADCNAHNKLTGHYSPAELQHALSTMPADISEYTDCAAVIQGQLLAELDKSPLSGGAGAGSGGSFLPVPVIAAIVVLALGAVALGAVGLIRRRPSQP